MKMRFVFANSWLFGGAIRKQLEKNPQLNAMQRTTTAVTVIRGGVKDNVLPSMARALVNFRLLPGDRLEDVLAHVKKAVRDDAVQVQAIEGGCWEASPVSPSDSPVFHNLSRTIRQVFPDALVAPYLVLGATDSRYYAPICPDVFRFSPYLLDSELLKSIHGIDERVEVDTLARMVQFYTVLIKSWTTAVGTAE
jgi:carboxypeptidase PM20D1